MVRLRCPFSISPLLFHLFALSALGEKVPVLIPGRANLGISKWILVWDFWVVSWSDSIVSSQ